MAEEQGQSKPLSRAERSVEIRVGARLENLAVVRTLVAAIAAFEDLDFDVVADLRLAVDEACTALIRAAVPESSLRLTVDPGDETVVITASTTCTGAAVVEPGSFSWHVLSSLTDEVKTFTDGDGPDTGQVFGITLMTRRASLLR
ncbi:ATP-binding protein [Mycolicibacterium nivoides]|uniref:ATP-binding protein n=1 Tax=Mycolicibacterium nivoides TaxID=2487344 RepID=UPI0008D5B098|nr:ATP-binding protein [Mycolicibacterium nivoides]SER55528.1 serine/threonine-protein kinase RsbW [Mycobacterium sp. 88mf]SFG31595.1 serine/threonine-protein kinase RsbW [Mycobacterium sp. 455mf]